MKSSITLLAVGMIGISACAKQPEDIAAVDIGPNAFAGYSCAQLATEELRVSQALENYSAQQRDAASGDALGVFLLGLPLSSMSGGDRQTDIAVARGQLQAIAQRKVEKRCPA